MLRLRGEKSRPQMIYLDGDLLLMSPSFIHERLDERLGSFVIEVVVGSSTSPACRRARRRSAAGRSEAGVEPDESFYLANERPIAAKDGKETSTSGVDPPPDLAIEVVHTHAATQAVEVLRRLGVPEVWVCDEDGLRILVLQANGRYAESETSLAFPFLTAGRDLRMGQPARTASDDAMDQGSPPMGPGDAGPARPRAGRVRVAGVGRGSNPTEPERRSEANRMATIRVPYPGDPEQRRALFERAAAYLARHGHV